MHTQIPFPKSNGRESFSRGGAPVQGQSQVGHPQLVSLPSRLLPPPAVPQGLPPPATSGPCLEWAPEGQTTAESPPVSVTATWLFIVLSSQAVCPPDNLERGQSLYYYLHSKGREI